LDRRESMWPPKLSSWLALTDLFEVRYDLCFLLSLSRALLTAVLPA
jgi:hypothetical protein